MKQEEKIGKNIEKELTKFLEQSFEDSLKIKEKQSVNNSNNMTNDIINKIMNIEKNEKNEVIKHMILIMIYTAKKYLPNQQLKYFFMKCGHEAENIAKKYTNNYSVRLAAEKFSEMFYELE